MFKDRQINLCLELLSIKNQVSGKSVFVPVKEGGMRMNIILGSIWVTWHLVASGDETTKIHTASEQHLTRKGETWL